MKDNMILGIKDILNNKVLFISAIVLIFILNYVGIVTTFSIRADFYERERVVTQEATGFRMIPTAYDIRPQLDFLVNYMSLLEQNAVSYRLSESITQELNAFVFLVFGDGTLINKSSERREEIMVYGYDEIKQSTIWLFNQEYPIHEIDYSTHNEMLFGDIQEEAILVVFDQESGLETLQRGSSENIEIIYDLLSQTKIRMDDPTRIQQFINLVNNEVEGIHIESPYLIDFNNYQSSNAVFIKHFLTPLYLVLFLLTVFSFSVVYKGILHKMRREFTIHVQNGACFSHIFTRLLIFFGSMVVCALFLAGITIRSVVSQEPMLLVSVLLTSGLILLSTAIYITYSLKQSNLFTNLRGDHL